MDALTADPYADDECTLGESGAVISPCERYRYRLWRSWGDGAGGFAVFIMCNPSTADAHVNDATIRKCIGFAQRWKMHGIRVVNLFALRSRDPNALSSDPAWITAIGADNVNHLRWVTAPHCTGADQRIVCAWGTPGNAMTKHRIREHSEWVTTMLRDEGRELWCLGTSKDGSPRHPLMLSYDTPLQPWRLP